MRNGGNGHGKRQKVGSFVGCPPGRMATLYTELESRSNDSRQPAFQNCILSEAGQHGRLFYTYVYRSGIDLTDNACNKWTDVAVEMCALYAVSDTKLAPIDKRNAPVTTKLSSLEVQ